MADYTADAAGSNVGTALTARTGTASADTVPAGAYLIVRNTGAGSHTVTFGNNFSVDGTTSGQRVWTVAAGAVYGGRVEARWGDSNGRVSVAINGTAAEVVYYIPGNV
jgi:hypothetical protein